MGDRVRVAWVMALLIGVAGCGGGGARFDAQNARAHVERLAGAIGSRPAGSSANQRARAYLIETLQLYGFDVRVQEADAQWREGGLTARVANLIAIRQGQQRDGIAIVAHYDSVTTGPGAGDDALGVAVALESARVLAARTSPRHTLMVLLTDAEEDGLMGARALVQDPQPFVRAFIAHRREREEQIVACLADGPRTIPEMVKIMYADVPEGLHRAAARSVLAHLVHMTDRGAVRSDAGRAGPDAVYSLPA